MIIPILYKYTPFNLPVHVMGVFGKWECSIFRKQKTESTGNLHRWRIFSPCSRNESGCAPNMSYSHYGILYGYVMKLRFLQTSLENHS